MMVGYPGQRCVWIVLLLISTSQVLSEEYPPDLRVLPVPSGTHVSWVGRELLHNGTRFNIQSFRSSQPIARVLNYYRDLWASNAGRSDVPGYQEQSIGEWSVIGNLAGRFSTVLQVKTGPQSTTVGFVSTVELHQRPRPVQLPNDISVPGGSVLLSHTTTGDQLKNQGTWIVENINSVSVNRRYFIRQMKFAGWHLAASENQATQVVMMFNAKRARCEITMTQSNAGKTIILINRVANND